VITTDTLIKTLGVCEESYEKVPLPAAAPRVVVGHRGAGEVRLMKKQRMERRRPTLILAPFLDLFSPQIVSINLFRRPRSPPPLRAEW